MTKYKKNSSWISKIPFLLNSWMDISKLIVKRYSNLRNLKQHTFWNDNQIKINSWVWIVNFFRNILSFLNRVATGSGIVLKVLVSDTRQKFLSYNLLNISCKLLFCNKILQHFWNFAVKAKMPISVHFHFAVLNNLKEKKKKKNVFPRLYFSE